MFSCCLISKNGHQKYMAVSQFYGPHRPILCAKRPAPWKLIIRNKNQLCNPTAARVTGFHSHQPETHRGILNTGKSQPTWHWTILASLLFLTLQVALQSLEFLSWFSLIFHLSTDMSWIFHSFYIPMAISPREWGHSSDPHFLDRKGKPG